MAIELSKIHEDNAQNQLLESERVKRKFVISNKICGIINFSFNKIINSYCNGKIFLF
jgi:hypothetical protein